MNNQAAARIVYWTYCSNSNLAKAVNLVCSARAAGVLDVIYVIIDSEYSGGSVIGAELVYISGIELLDEGARLIVCLKTAFSNMREEYLVYLDPELSFLFNPDLVSAIVGCGSVLFLKEYFSNEEMMPAEHINYLLFRKFRICSTTLIPRDPRIWVVRGKAVDAVFSVTQEIFTELASVGAPKSWRLVAFLIDFWFTAGLVNTATQQTLLEGFNCTVVFNRYSYDN